MDTVVVSDLKKSYGPVRAVDGISFTVGSGEVFGLLGPNGAGKSTTVEILAGLRQRDAGEVSVLGLDPQSRSAALKPRIGMQLQTPSMYPRLKVREILRLFASFYPERLSPDEVLDRVGLKGSAGVLASQLSGGQVQRLSIATAMIGNGEIMFLDEPTTGLDPQARRRLWEVITSLRDMGKTVLLTTHNMEEAERLCNRVAIIDHGKIIAMDAPRQLVSQHFRERAVEFNAADLPAGVDLGGLSGVTRVDRRGDVVTLYTEEASLTVESLLAVGNGAVRDFGVRPATLEDVFLKLTGRRIRE